LGGGDLRVTRHHSPPARGNCDIVKVGEDGLQIARTKMFSRAVLLMLLALIALPTLSRPAKADHSDAFVQVTCVPTLDYFSIRTFDIENTPMMTAGPELEKQIEREGVQYLADFVKKPAECRLSAHSIEVESTDFRSDGPDNCSENGATFHIKVDGKEIYKFDAFGGYAKCNQASHVFEYHRDPRMASPDIEDCEGEGMSPYMPYASIPGKCKIILPYKY
jgi:hypothetical protein